MTEAENKILLEGYLELANDVSLPLQPGEHISALAGTPKDLFVGTSRGYVFSVFSSGTGFNVGHKVHLGPSAVTQMEFVSGVGMLLAISGQTLFEIVPDSMPPMEIIGSRKHVWVMALNSNPQNDDPFSVDLAFSCDKTVYLATKRVQKKLDIYDKIVTDGIILSLQFSRDTVAYATSGQYSIYNATSKSSIPLFPIEKASFADIITIDSNEFLMRGHGLAMFVTVDGISLKPPIVFDNDVIDTTFHSPHVFVLGTKTISVYGKDDSKLVEAVENIAGLRMMWTIDGVIFACTENRLLQLKSSSIKKIVEVLIRNEKFEEAIDACEKEYTLAPSDDTLNLVLEVKRSAGIKALREADWENAYHYLNHCDALEVIRLLNFDDIIATKNISTEMTKFLRKFLQAALVHPDITDDIKTKVEEVLIRNNWFGSDYGSWTSQQHEVRAELLVQEGQSHEAAIFFVAAGVFGKAAEIWAENNHNGQTRTEWKPDDTSVKSFFTWVVENRSSRAVEIITKSKMMALADCATVLDGSQLYLEFLKVNSNDKDVMKKLLTHLAKKAKNGEIESRQELRQSLLSAFSRNQVVESEIDDILTSIESFEIEKKMTNWKLPEKETKDILAVLLNEGDCNSADAYVELLGDTYNQLYLSLFKYYIAKTSEDQQYCRRAMELLAKSKSHGLDTTQIQLLPDFIKLNESDFLQKLMSSRIEQGNSQKLLRAAQNAAAASSSHLPLPPIKLEENQLCAACHLELDFIQGAIVALPSGYVIHASCIRYPGLCPVSNQIFGKGI